MIYIAYGVINQKTAPRYYIHDMDGYFDGYFEDSWMKNDIAKRAISEIDKSELIAPKVIESPILGQIPYTWISGGSKIIIMMNIAPDVIYDGDNLGDNCWPLFLELGKTKDIAISLSYFPQFEWIPGGLATSLDTGRIIHNFDEFADEFLRSSLDTREFDDIDWPIKIDTEKFKPDEIDF